MPAKKNAASAAAASKPANAIKLLKDDHKTVQQCFKDYEKLVKSEADESTRKALAEQICELLTVHAQIEEEIFYPAARAVLDEGQDLLDEAAVEHASAKDLIAQIQSMQPSDDLYDAKVTVLGEYIQHHVKEEETEMFAALKKTDMDMVAIGEQLTIRKQELMNETQAPA